MREGTEGRESAKIFTNKKESTLVYYGNLPPLPLLPSLPPYLCTRVKLPASLLPTISCKNVSASGTIPFIFIFFWREDTVPQRFAAAATRKARL